MSWEKLFNSRSLLIVIVLAASLVWANSLTSEFSGYDDISLIATKEKVHKGALNAAETFISYPSLSNNLAWSNRPNFIYRPLEWIGSSLGYSLWGAKPLYFHIFFNYSLHLLNTILVFLILSRIIDLPAAAAITLIWTVHPLHSEALNMLTSGVGFLWANFFALLAFYLLTGRTKYLWLLALPCLLLGFWGSEMLVILPLLLLAYYIYNYNFNAVAINWLRLGLSWLVLLFYYNLRLGVLSDGLKWQSIGEFLERTYVLAPQIFLHYLKLYFFPQILTIDQHHQVLLADAFSSYHIFSLVVLVLFLIASVYFVVLNFKSDQNTSEIYLITGFFLISLLSLVMVLNIIPLYVLARERYTYVFVLAMTAALVLLVRRYCKPSPRLSVAIVLILVLILGARSVARNNDWRNGESLWLSTIAHTSDIGAKQIWRHRLLEYYAHPGTKTFVVDESKRANLISEYNQFINVNKLNLVSTIQGLKRDSGLESKYAFVGAKSIASALYFMAISVMQAGNNKLAFEIFKLAHNYYPEHFQTNLFLLRYIGTKHPAASKLLALMVDETEHSPYQAKALLDLLLELRDASYHQFAQRFAKQYPRMIDFKVALYNSLLVSGRRAEAYTLAKQIQMQYKGNDAVNKYIAKYEQANN